MKLLRRNRRTIGILNLLAITAYSTFGYADTLYKTNAGANGVLDTQNTTPTAPSPLIQTYAEGTAFTAGDSIAFNNLISGATTFRVSATTGTNLSVGGLTIGSLFNGSLLNPGGAITIQNGAGASGSPVANTLTLGAGGIDLSLAAQNLTISADTTNGSSLAFTTSANQTWTVRNGRTLTLAASTNTLAHNVNIGFVGGAQGGTMGIVTLGSTTVGLAGSGDMNITGMNGGASATGTGGTVTMLGNNSSWTGAVTVAGGARLNLDYGVASQNKLADAKTLVINRGQVNLQNTLAATELVAGVSLGQGLNMITRSAGSAVLQANSITHAALGSAVDFGNIATSGASHVTTDVSNTAAGQIGAWAVGINGTTDANWIKTAASAADTSALALSGSDYTTQNNLNSWLADQNILVTGATTANTAGNKTIGSLKMNTGTVASLDIGASNTLTINDSANGGGILGVGNFARTIGHASTIGQGTLTAGVNGDTSPDTLYIYNLQNTTTINMVIADNGTGAGNELHLFTGGAGTVTLNAANTFTGGITIAAGVLNLGSNAAASDAASLGSGAIVNHGTLVISKSTGATDAQMTFVNNISGTGGVTINRDSAFFSGNNTYQGDLNFGGATVTATTNTGFSPDARLVATATGTVNLSDELAALDVSVAALRSTVDGVQVNLNDNTLTLSGSDKARPGTNDATLSTNPQIYQGGILGSGNLVKNGLYTQQFTTGTGGLGYTGTTTVNAGVLQTNRPMSTSSLTVNTTSGNPGTFVSNIANSLTGTTAVNLAGLGATWQINNGFNQSVGALTGVANARLAIAKGVAATNLTVTDNGGSPATFAGVIQETGTGVQGASFTKAGTNTLILTGGNNYSGATSINDGTLQIGAVNPVQVIPDRSALVLADVATAVFDLNANSETIGSLAGGGATGGTVALGAGTLTTGIDNTSTTFAGVISGAGSLVKTGSGILTLTGANLFTGGITLRSNGGLAGIGGLTIGAGGSLADTATVRNAGYNTVFTVNNTDTMGAVTGTANSSLVLGSGVVLTSNYVNGAGPVLGATADSASANGRIVRNINTVGLKPGDLISGTGVSAPGYIVQIIDNDTVLVNRTPPTGPTVDFTPTVTSVNVLNSAISGSGAFVKDGTGLLVLTGNNTQTGTMTITNGTVQIGGIWNGQKFSLQDVLSDSAQLVFSGTNATTLQFADSSTNVLSFERVGSIAGGAGATTSINLEAGSTTAVLAVGIDNSTSTFTGQIMGPSAASTMLIKEGTGNFTWSNPTTNVFDGPIYIDRGMFTIAGAQGFDGSNEVWMTNAGTALTINTTGGDSIPYLIGGAGSTRGVMPAAATGGTTSSTLVGATSGNYLTSGTTIVNLTTGLTVTEGTATNIYTFNGDIQGAATFSKGGAHQLNLTGVSSNAFTGETQVTAGTLRMGILGAATGVGAPTAGQSGTLSTGTGLRLTGGILDLNGTSQTVTRINASSTAGTIQLVNGALTLSNQNTQSTATVLTGNLNSVLHLNASAAATLTVTGNSNTFAGSYNLGTNAALTSNLSGGALGDTARVNLNGTGTQLTVTLADTIGSLAGTGDAVLTQNLTLSEARSGTVSAAGYAGATSGAGALVLSGFGGLTLSGNNAHSGGTTLSSNASLVLNYGAGNNILPGTGVLTLNGATLRIISSAGAPVILESVASTSLNAGLATVETWAGYNAQAALTQGLGMAGINLGLITRAAGGTLNVAANSAAATNSNTNGIIGGYAIVDGNTWAVANGGSAAISGLPTASYAGTFAPGANVDLDATNAVAGGTANTVRFNNAGALNLSAATTLEAGGILVTPAVGGNTSNISGALNATGNELIIHQYNPVGTLVLSNIGGANTAVTTAGSGRILITNDISGSGATTIGYGYLQLGDNTVGGGSAGMVGTGNILNNGTLGVNRSGNVTFGAAVLSGAGNFEQLGSGVTTLGGANTLAGRITVRNGTLEITNNAGLGVAATAPSNRWANLTSIHSGGTLRVNVTAGGTITEVLNFDGGTLDLRSAVASTMAGVLVLSKDSTLHVGNAAGASVNHLITGEILAAPGADLTITNAGGATPSTLVLAPALTTGSRWEKTTINSGGRLQIGNNSRGFLGTGAVTNNGTLILRPNDAHFFISNDFSGSGTLELNRATSGNTYFVGDLSGFSGTLLVTASGANASSVAELGNDTYEASIGSGPMNMVANAFTGTSGSATVRTHFNQDLVVSNAITLTPATDGTNPKNAQFFRGGLGSMTLNGTITLGATNAAPGTQRNVIQTDPGGKLVLNATLSGVSANNVLNIVNNNIVVIGGSASQTYNGILSGNNVWVFANSGTTTLSGANTFDTANTYIQKGTINLTGGAAVGDNTDVHLLRDGSLNVNASETIGQLHSQAGSTINIASGVTLTIDDSANQLIAGTIAGSGGNLAIGATSDSQTAYIALYGTNTATGTLNIGGAGGTTSRFGGIQVRNLADAIGSFSTLNLGVSGGSGGFIDYVGSGETFAKTINLGGGTTATTNRITASGNGALTLSGPLTLAGGSSTLQLSGQTGGYFNGYVNTISGAITEGTNTLTLSMPATANDDRFGVTSRWALTNSGNDYSGNVTVNVGMLEFGGNLGSGGAVGTSQLGDLTATRTFTLGTNDFDGRRYDIFGSTDQLSAVGSGQGTNTLTPSGATGTIIFNGTGASTFTVPSTVTWTQSFSSTTNPGSGQIINDGAGAVVLQGAFTSGASGNRTWFLDGTNTATNTISGIISNGTSNTVSVTKEGAGTWRLSGANTYTGTTTINNGTLELAGGAAIADTAGVAINGDGGDGLFSGMAKLRVINSETIATLSGDVLMEAEILLGQTLTISGGSSTMNGLITGSGNLTRTMAGSGGGTLTTSDKNTYSGSTTISATGTASANAGLTIYHLANGGVASGLGSSSNAAANLLFGTDTAGDNGGILTWSGFADQSTDRLFTMGLGVAGARINASGSVIGTTVPAMTWSNTGAIAFTGSGTRTLTLGGSGLVDNVFRPQITDGGGATALIKTDAGIWVLNPGASGNTYTGGTSITGGTVAISAANALGTNTITINGVGGVGLELRGGITLANNITNLTDGGGLRATSGSSILTGLVTITNPMRVSIDSGASVELNNATSSVTGAGALLKLGNGTLVLSGINSSTWTGATTVSNGVLKLAYGTNDTSKLADTGVLTLGGIGALTTTGLDANVPGQTNISGQGGGTIELSGGSHIEIVGSTTIASGSNAITLSSGSAKLRLNAIARAASAGTIDFGAASIADSDTSDTNGILGVGYATVAKTDWAHTIATGAADTAITAFSAYNTDSYGATNNVDVTTYTGATTGANTLRFNNAAGGTLTLGGATFAMTGGGLLVTPNVTTGDVIINGAAIQNAATTAGLEALIIHQHSARALQIDSVIQNNTGAQALTKTGAGKLFLNGLNTYTGNVNLFEGEIQVGGTAAAPTTATNAYLSGVAVSSGNMSAGWNLANGTTLRFLTTNTTLYNTPLIVGDGAIIFAQGNQSATLFDDDNTAWRGDMTFSGGTIRVATNAAALGSTQGLLDVNNSVNFIFNSAVNINKVTNYSQGTTFNVLNNTATSAGTFSGVQRFNNTTTAGLEFNIAAPTTAGTVGLNLSGVVYGSNGFTKTGNGILQISNVNFAEAYDGWTIANKTPTLSGQIAVNGGVLNVGNARALGAFGVGNETIVASGASVDLRGAALNNGDDPDPNREILKITGTGFNNTGALRNSTGTGTVSFLTLDGSALINSGGTANGSALVLSTFDTHLSNANGLPGALTRNRPTINGGGFDLTIQGGRNATDNFVIADPTFSSALNKLIIREGGARFRHEVAAVVTANGISSSDITNGVEIGYGGVTAADLTGALAGTGANVGARLLFENYYNVTHSVDFTMNGTLAATAAGTPGGTYSLAGGHNYLQADFFTIPDATMFFTGDINLIGDALRNIIFDDSLGNYTVVEQGNLTVSPATKMIFSGNIQGTGGFTKMGSGDIRLTAENTFDGDLNVLRYGFSAAPFETHTYKINGVDYTTKGLAEGWAEWSLTLLGPDGKLTNVDNINLQRRGMLTLDNTTRLNATSGLSSTNNTNLDRIPDTAALNMSNGWLRLNGGAVASAETIGTMNILGGTNIVDMYPTDGAGVNMTLTINTLNRSAGGAVRFTNLDPTATFSTTAVGDSVRVAVGTLNASQFGGSGLANTTNRSIVQGVFGGNVPLGLDTAFRVLGFNNGNASDLWNQQRNLQFLAGSHFMTYDGGFLRPLDDDEYYAPTDGTLGSSTPALSNVNLSDVYTIVKEDMSINALRFGALSDNESGVGYNSTTAITSLIDHHAINLMVDGTLTINSGMISAGYFTIGNTSSASAVILGGALDFNGKEAILNAQNGFYRLTDGTIQAGSLEIRSAITNAAGLTKTGAQQVNFEAANTYAGLTTINEGTLFLRHGRTALGVGGSGNGVVITGAGNLSSGNGIVVGTPAAREDIYVGPLQGDQVVMRIDNDVTVWNSNLTIDNVDLAGMPLFTPRLRADNSATFVINGNIGGGNTPISNDVTQIDSRVVQFDGSGGNVVYVMHGQFGDRLDASGNAVPVANPVSLLPTLVGTRSNENEVLRVNFSGGSDESNWILDRQYNAAGRLTLIRGMTIVNYDPAAAGNDGTGFWTDTAISRIPNADSLSTTYTVNGGATLQGFIMGNTSNLTNGLFLARPGQIFNMAHWTMAGSGSKYIGGLNQTGTVTFGTGTAIGGNSVLTVSGAAATLYAVDGGTVVFNQRITGNAGTAPANFGIVKQGLGTVELRNVGTTAGDSNFVLAGGTLILNHSGGSSLAILGNQNARFDGGTLISIASTGVNTAESYATDNTTDRVLNFNLGGTEIVARTATAGTPRNMTIALGNANANNNATNFTRALGTTANLVEDSTVGGTAQITLQFNSFSTAAVKNQVIPWATYGTLSRTAVDFAMADSGNSNDVRTLGRALDEYTNNVAAWGANQDVSENGGAGFAGSLAGPLTLSTLRFDANADSSVNLGANVLTVAGNGLASSGGAILVSSNVGTANKTITGTTGAGLTTSGGQTELMIHHYGLGNLNINVPITGAGVDLTIAGPTTTNAANFGTTGAVVLGAINTYDGQTFVNGSILSFNNAAQLGTNATAAAIVMNGGTLRYTGSSLQSLGSKGIRFDPNGGVIDVSDGAGELYIDAEISNASQFRGDMVKIGAGTLTLNGTLGAFGSAGNPSFRGRIDVRQGTLRIAGDVGNNGAGNGSSEFIAMLGTSLSYADGTIMRPGTNLAIQMGNANDSTTSTNTFTLTEWLTFEGSNYVSVGTINTQTGNTADTAGATELSAPVPNPNNERPVNLAGVNTINGTVTFDVVPSQTLQLNGGNVGFTTGNGDVIKDGQGTLSFNTNNPDFTGNIVIKQGRVIAVGQADPLGTGYLTGRTITLGSNDRQGTADLTLSSDSVQGHTMEINHNVNVAYNPALTKSLRFETFANGSQIEMNGNVTLNDNLQVFINDSAETGGSVNYVNFNGQLLDGSTTSGNLVFTVDDAGGGANDNTTGRPYGVLVLKNDNSGWTGDVRVNSQTSYDQDQAAILRLEHAQALTAANDVDMGFNSTLQVGGAARTIGSLTTNGGVGPFTGVQGTMGAITNGTSVVIENAAGSAGALTITQSTPATTEVQWNAYFRNGTLNSEFFANGTNTHLPAGALSITKAGSGWATLAVDNAHTGTTTVTGGILQVGRAGVGDSGAANAAGFTSNAGTTVAGTGVIQGTTLIRGNLKPGDEAGGSVGTLTINGNATLDATSTTTLQVQRPSYTAFNALGYDDAGYASWISGLTTDATYSHLLDDPVTAAQHDQLRVTGTLGANSGAKVVLANNGYNPTHGDVFNLMDWSGVATSFNVGGTSQFGGLFRTGAETGYDIELFELGSGFRWDMSLFNSYGIAVVVTPEPSRMLLLFFGLTALFLRRRRGSAA